MTGRRGVSVAWWGALAVCAAVAGCLPTETSREFSCLSDGQCAQGWTCAGGVCRKACDETTGCPQADFHCREGLCLPGGGEPTSGDLSSSGAVSGLPGSSSRPGSGGGSGGHSSSGPVNNYSTLGIIVVTGGGGAAPGNEWNLQLCVGQSLASEKINNSQLMTLSLGLYSVVEPWR